VTRYPAGPTMTRTICIVLSAAAFAAAGCGGGGGSAKPAAIPAGPGPTTPTTPQASTNLKDTKSKPAVPKQTGPPPKKLVVKDIVVGKGRAAKKGDHLSMQYVGVTYADGKEFDASWDNGQPFPLQLGKGMVIKGWDQGLVGIKPGGRRELIIPAQLAYGAAGRPPAIPPNAALVFIVDALTVGK
jgi:FKBP-type peptidyl-prolyl cis-trans isomerase